MVALSYGVVSDVVVPAERGRMLGPMLSATNVGASFGPVIGGGIALGTDGFIWCFLALTIFASIAFLLVGFTLPETGRKIVGNGDQLAARRLWRSWWSLIRERRAKGSTTAATERLAVSTIRFPNPFMCVKILLVPEAALILWVVASSYSVWYVIQTIIPTIFQQTYRYNELQIGLAYLPGCGGLVFGGLAAGKLMDRNYTHFAEKSGLDPRETRSSGGLSKFPIEKARFRFSDVYLLLEAVSLIGYGWAVHYEAHPAVLMVLQFIACGLSTMLMHSSNALLVDIFPDNPSTAYAAGNVSRCGLSAGVVAALHPLVSVLGAGWFFTGFALIVGFSGIAATTVSQWKGETWRKKRMSATSP